MGCELCTYRRDHRPQEGDVGGYVYEDEHWYAYHAPVATAMLGQLFLVSKRHFLDFTEMTAEEAVSYGPVLGRLGAALKHVAQAERVYVLVTVEGMPHFHAWLIPRKAGLEERGWALVTSPRSCSADDALRVVSDLRGVLTFGPSPTKLD
jgi:diadenosine tetraphosphate (Ap4A) HIT family hydrolase